MANSAFQLLRPRTLEAAQSLLFAFPAAAVLAGGQQLVPQWRYSAMPREIVSLSDIVALKGIGIHRGTLSLGATVTLSDLSASSVVGRELPELAHMASNMGDHFMRNRATVGGAVCTTNGPGCLPAALIGCGATVHTTSRRALAAEWFAPTGGLACLEPAELVVRVSIPLPLRASHKCLRVTPSRFALVTVFASAREGVHCVGVSGLTTCSSRSKAAEEWLDRCDPNDTESLAQVFLGDVHEEIRNAGEWYRISQAQRLLRSASVALREAAQAT